ncbi:unnamed protein product [Phytomonas sp. EM1]|nr:unnamed protein product [Phytomonas sp. EM1]|eukprot:CCW60654.1 unnamed protein product [Phytomonas sp. isolate EM1]
MEPNNLRPRDQEGGNSSDTSKSLKQYFSPPINPRSPLLDFVPSGLSTLARRKAPSTLLISSKESDLRSRGANFKPLSNVETSTETHNRIQPPQRAATTSYMSPIFHFTSHDTRIIAMEHNNHYKLMAISTSRREIFVTLTQEMPVVENMGAIKASEDPFGAGGGLSGLGVPPPPFLNEGLLKWDPAEMTVLVDQLQFPCTQLEWGPWQHGVYLAGMCPGWQIRVYRFSHSRWALDAEIKASNGVSIAFSSQCTLACACNSGEILLFVRRSDSSNGEGPWVLCCTFLPGPEDHNITILPRCALDSIQEPGSSSVDLDPRFSNTSNLNTSTVETKALHVDPSMRCLCVHFDDSGSLLASGFQDGSVRVFLVVDGGTRVGDLVFSSGSTHRNNGMCRQVVWSPSSGRNFLLLAIVYANYFTILLFQRPRLHNFFFRSTGLTSGANALFPHAHMYAPLSDSGVGGRNTAKISERSLKLHVLESKTALCEGISKLSWNTTGTRFVTSHADGLVNAWSVDINYVQRHEQHNGMSSNCVNDKGMVVRTGIGLHGSTSYGVGDETSHLSHGYQQRTSEGGIVSGESLTTPVETCFSGNAVKGGDKPVGEHRVSEPKLSIFMSLRKVLSAHPYHTIITK